MTMTSSSTEGPVTPEFDSPPLKRPERSPAPADIVLALQGNADEMAEMLLARMSKQMLRLTLVNSKTRMDLADAEPSEKTGVFGIHHNVVLYPSGSSTTTILETALANFMSAIRGITMPVQAANKLVVLKGALDTKVKRFAPGVVVISWRQMLETEL